MQLSIRSDVVHDQNDFKHAGVVGARYFGSAVTGVYCKLCDRQKVSNQWQFYCLKHLVNGRGQRRMSRLIKLNIAKIAAQCRSGVQADFSKCINCQPLKWFWRQKRVLILRGVPNYEFQVASALGNGKHCFIMKEAADASLLMYSKPNRINK